MILNHAQVNNDRWLRGRKTKTVLPMEDIYLHAFVPPYWHSTLQSGRFHQWCLSYDSSQFTEQVGIAIPLPDEEPAGPWKNIKMPVFQAIAECTGGYFGENDSPPDFAYRVFSCGISFMTARAWSTFVREEMLQGVAIDDWCSWGRTSPTKSAPATARLAALNPFSDLRNPFEFAARWRGRLPAAGVRDDDGSWSDLGLRLGD